MSYYSKLQNQDIGGAASASTSSEPPTYQPFPTPSNSDFSDSTILFRPRNTENVFRIRKARTFLQMSGRLAALVLLPILLISTLTFAFLWHEALHHLDDCRSGHEMISAYEKLRVARKQLVEVTADLEKKEMMLGVAIEQGEGCQRDREDELELCRAEKKTCEAARDKFARNCEEEKKEINQKCDLEEEKCRKDLGEERRTCEVAKEKSARLCEREKNDLEAKCQSDKDKKKKEWEKEKAGWEDGCTRRLSSEVFALVKKMGSNPNTWLCSDETPAWKFGYTSTDPLPSDPASAVQVFESNFTSSAALHFPSPSQPPVRVVGYEVMSGKSRNGWWRMGGLSFYGGESVAFQAKGPVFGTSEYGVKIFYVFDM